ncbi:hypothetical protein VNO78_17243 [Psophocarpus tetragonolobus]|uniref:Uncharacterized protein n=1 Tax=Psophocarpus tetragonolobus TaxID=3891 RepID=A0AAN9SGT0_PSOTE
MSYFAGSPVAIHERVILLARVIACKSQIVVRNSLLCDTSLSDLIEQYMVDDEANGLKKNDLVRNENRFPGEASDADKAGEEVPK